MMGSPNNEQGRSDDEGPQTRVTLTRGFYMGETQVTQAQWQAVMGENPSQFKGATQPVECVSWYDAVKFCAKLSEKTGQSIQLPTEAQWEYACRAGTTTRWSFGDNESALRNYVWFRENSNNHTQPVGQKQANPWGLHDMHGNVWEWCLDWYGAYPGGNANDFSGSSSGSRRVIRGGSWYNNPQLCRSAGRGSNTPADQGYNRGFRPVLAFQ